MLTPRWARRCHLVTALMAGLALGATGSSALAAHGGGGGGGFHGGGGAFQEDAGGLRGGGVAHFSGRSAYGRGYARGYYGRGYYGGGWWGPGWWGLGLFLPIIPWYYETYWWAGIPYYYGDNAYYVWDGDAGEYEQVAPPADFSPNGPPASAPGPNGAPPANSDLFAYPKAGQSPAQQARDKAECSKWASDQVASQGASGGPPPGAGGAPQSGPGAAGGPAASDAMAKHQAYLRAEAVCLEGRNYSVG